LNIPVTMTSAALLDGRASLNVFIDWNSDGDVSDANETQTAKFFTASGTQTFSITAPIGTSAGTKFMRVRLTEGSTAPPYAGHAALKGEVEDYSITVGVLSPLLEWTMEDTVIGGTVSQTSYADLCIFANNGLNHSDDGTILTTSELASLNGPKMNGSKVRVTSGWDNTDQLTLPRPDHGFNDRVLTCSFAFNNLTSLTWGNFCMDLRRPSATSPTKFRAALIWFQSSYPYRSLC
jgi:hypothetical protein